MTRTRTFAACLASVDREAWNRTCHSDALPEMQMVPDKYRSWTIHQGRWPEPAWMAFGPNYDASWEGEEDGWTDNGEKAEADTRAALLDEIDAWFDDQPDPRASLRFAIGLALLVVGMIGAHAAWIASGMPVPFTAQITDMEKVRK